MSRTGRPLRFLKLLVGGWVGVRAVSLLAPAMWTIAVSESPREQIALRPLRDDGGSSDAVALAAMPDRRDVAIPARRMKQTFAPPRRPGAFGPVAIPGTGWRVETADMLLQHNLSFNRPRIASGVVDRLGQIAMVEPGRAAPVAPGTGLAIAPDMAARGRWSGTAWLLWRPEMRNGFAQAPLLGGSQAGARLDYRLGGGVSAYGRASRAFVGPSSEEAALGVAWRPGRAPVSLLVERRQRLGPGGRNGFAAIMAGGIGPRDIAPRIEAEGYAQAGIVGLPGSDAFADGKMNLGYRLTPAAERSRVTLGASLSGSVQPGASRVDIGPELKLRFPVAGATMRLSTEWRARVAGDARPANGPAITLVTDF